MYSLGIIFFEMSFHLKTGMERIQTLSALRKTESNLPLVFHNDHDKAKHGQIILSLVNHNPRDRPSSSELLRSGQIPIHNEDELMRTARRNLLDPESDFRSQLITTILSEAATKHLDNDRSSSLTLKDYMYDLHGWPLSTIEESLLQDVVKRRLTSIFRRHGAIEITRPSLFPYASAYSNHSNQACKLIDPNGSVLQLPFDLTLPNARILAKHSSCAPKTFTFGDVYREIRSGGHPRIAGEVDFDIISYDNLDLALREAEVIKVLDEIINAFPSMSSVQMCYNINHSRILDAILNFCNISKSKQPAVKDCISRLNIADSNWAKIRSELRAPPLSIPATSLEELIRFDFQDRCPSAVSKLRQMLQDTAALESTFAHLQAVTTYLERFNVKRKAYIHPLSSYNEKFYRGNMLFQCIYSGKRKSVFAAGGRYDQLIKDHQLFQDPRALEIGRLTGGRNVANCHAVGFNLSWQDLHKSMLRYYKAAATGKSKEKRESASEFSLQPLRRCEVLVDSFDKNLLRTAGINIIQELWEHDIHAELALDHGFNQEAENAALYGHGQDNFSYSYVLMVKQEGIVKVRNVAQNDEVELRASELDTWLKAEFAHRDRNEDSGRRLHRQSSHPDEAAHSFDDTARVRVLMSQTKGKKTNRRTIVKEGEIFFSV